MTSYTYEVEIQIEDESGICHWRVSSAAETKTGTVGGLVIATEAVGQAIQAITQAEHYGVEA